MAKNAVTDWSTTAANNTDAGGIGIQGSNVPSNFDDAIREVMAQIAAFREDATFITLRATSFYLGGTALSLFQPGMLMPYAGGTAPTGWLFCYGQAVSRTTYDDLFATIGTAYGTGDGSTTFNLPDLRGRVVAGKDNMGGTSANRLTDQTGGLNGDTLGATGGSETHTLTVAQMPSHDHGGDTGAGGAHSHTVPFRQDSASNDPSNLGPGTGASDTVTTSTAAAHTHTISSQGGGSAHNNLQPSIVMNFLIKT